MTTIDAVAATSDGLEINIGGVVTTLSWRWVRDHGEDETSFDPTTQQRRVFALDVQPPRAATKAEHANTNGAAAVVISWPEPPHQTWISESTLTSLLAPAPRATTAPWHTSQATSVTKGDVAAVVHNKDALAAFVGDIATFGFGLLGGFAGGHDDVSTLAKRIGNPSSTIFGTTWDLASDVDAHDDTAYTQTFLAPHTDGTYMHNAPGLQMFCCTERTGTGGESVIVDAFALAETLRTEHPADFAVLTTVSVPGHYIEPGIELRSSRPAIRLDDGGTVVQVSMNNYDRSPMYLPAHDMAAFYQAYGNLHALANDRDRWHSIRLEAGDVLINDNWRVLHGREAYTGGRRFVGCYLNHSDLESCVRTLGV